MKKLRLKNIKSFIDSGEIEYKPLTIFVGPNSSGKSSLLRFPVVIAQTFKEDVYAPLLLFGKSLDYGNFSDVVHKNQGNKIEFEIQLREKTLRQLTMSSLRKTYFNKDRKTLENISLRVELEKKGKKFFVSKYRLSLRNGLYFEIEGNEKGNYEFKTNIEIIEGEIKGIEETFKLSLDIHFDKFIPRISLLEEDLSDLIINKTPSLKAIERILKKYMEIEKTSIIRHYDSKYNRDLKFEKEIKYISKKTATIDFFDNFNRTILRNLNEITQDIIYVGPFRQNPQRTYRNIESNFKDVGINGENTMLLLRQDLEHKGILLKKVSKWIKNAIGQGIEIKEIENSNFFQLMVTNENNSDNVIDVGFGISQVLPIITQLYHKKNLNTLTRRYLRGFQNQFLIIEQPELHLHPAAQTALADIFVDSIIENKKRDVICIETHSEHLIRKLQVLVADPSVEINNNDIAIYYVDKQNNGEGKVTLLDLDETGQFTKKWPSGFFDRSYGLTMELMKANQRRNKNEI